MKKNSRKAKSAGRSPKTAPAATAQLAPGRKWLFRFVALVVLPLLGLIGLEAALRLAGYGHATGFFEKIRTGEKDFLVNNENFSLRFFPPPLARWPGPIMMEARKPANVFRIFILGESAARGEPEPPYAASRYLETLLNDRYSKIRFEVVNLGITAINSHVILPIARDCARCDGDLWIIYMGNNEMVGPFGAATVFGAKAPPLASVRLNLALQKFRLGQLLVDAARKLKGDGTNASWGGMKMFLGNQLRANDPRKETVYKNFEQNLQDIVRVGLDSGAKILLNTVAVNLRDCPPFASLAGTDLSAIDRAPFEKYFAEGCAAQKTNDFTAASRSFEQAARLDGQFPELQFRLAECLLRMGNLPAAREHFQLACDGDALPFRADTRINRLINEVASRFHNQNLAVFDAAGFLAKDVFGGVCGQETFFEHVHFNFDGNYRLGRAWAEQVEHFLPAEVSRSGLSNAWVSQEACEQQLGLSDWNRCAVVESVIDRLHRPPLSSQPNNAARLASLQARVQTLRQQMNPESAAKAADVYRDAIQRSPRDYLLHENFAEFLESNRDLKQATAQWQQVCELLPHNSLGYFQMGRLLGEQERWSEAEPGLTRAVALRPRLAEGWFELGNVHLATGRFDLALRDYERAGQLEPADGTYCAYAGKALSKLNRRTEAIQRYRQAIQLQPDAWEAHFALGDELVTDNQIAAARGEYEAVIRLKPANALAHLDLGVMLARLGRFDEALSQFELTLQLEPANQQAREYLDRVRDWKNRPHSPH